MDSLCRIDLTNDRNDDPSYHGRHLQRKSGGGGGDNWDIKIFNATNCERSRRVATLGGGRV